MAKRGFSSRLASDEITTREYKTLHLQSVQFFMIAEVTIKSSLRFSLD
jgi:hypothetical protein